MQDEGQNKGVTSQMDGAVEDDVATQPGADAGAPLVEEPVETVGRVVEDELTRARAQAAEYEERRKRAAAEFINYKRRTEQERGDLLRGANGRLILELLPVLDDLERALANVPAGEAESKWVEGTRLVERKFRQILERQGLTPIETLGQPFDPALHEAVGGSGPTVTEEYQRGYKLHGRPLRPAMVVVGDESPRPEATRGRQSSEATGDDELATTGSPTDE